MGRNTFVTITVHTRDFLSKVFLRKINFLLGSPPVLLFDWSHHSFQTNVSTRVFLFSHKISLEY